MSAVASVKRLFDQRVGPAGALADDADVIAQTAYAMAARFHRGGRLIVFGNGGTATDAHHVVVEFVHPVIVGKRALPAVALTSDPATVTGIARTDGFDEVFAAQVRLISGSDDIALALSADGDCVNVRRALAAANALGMLTVALVGDGGGAIGHAETSEQVDHIIIVASADPAICKEVFVTAYHILWELVHVLFEHPSVFKPEVVR